MRATVEYDTDDIKRLICRDLLMKFGVKMEPGQVQVTVSKTDQAIVYETDLNTGKKEQAK